MDTISQSTHQNLFGHTIRTTLVEHNQAYFVISESNTECLIFSSDSEGKHDFVEIGSALHTADAIRQIQNGHFLS